MRYITIAELRRKLGGRSRNAIFDDVARGLLPRPFKLQKGQGGRNYWVETEVDEALEALAEEARREPADAHAR